jgi:spore coat polysaccharide biosynthesis protein SpsF
MSNKLNEQEKFWFGDFGKKYISRNNSKKIQKNTDIFFKKIFKKKINLNTIIELGANVGNNIKSLSKIYPKSKITSVEINEKACKILRKKFTDIKVINSSLASLKINETFELVLCKGILIHINPRQLNKIYDKIYSLSKKYILIAEYYSPTPTKIIYRGKKNKLFKRDFAGDLINRYNLKLIDYGFSYRYDKYPQDDLTWFLLKKN